MARNWNLHAFSAREGRGKQGAIPQKETDDDVDCFDAVQVCNLVGNTFADTIADLDGRIVDMERRIEQKRLNLVGRFASLEGTIANLQSQGNFLSGQLAGLSR